MKAAIYKNVARRDVPKRVVSEFSGAIDLALLREDFYTVIVYSGMKNNSTTILNSTVLLKALKKAALNKETIVVAAHAFTQEAYKLLNEHNAIGFPESDHYYWTDESVNNIRQK